MQSFDYLIIDTVNLAYQVFNSPQGSKSMREASIVRERRVYPHFISSFIETVKYLEAKYSSKEVILLYDNYSSREQLKEMLKPLKESSRRKDLNPNYKASRKSAKLEFYNSLDLIRYYYCVNEPKYHTARIPNLEADDLVKPCLEKIDASKNTVLLVTNDSDWTRYLSETVKYLPEVYEDPQGVDHFYDRYGFYPSEDKVTLYKIIFGDSADNVSPVFPEFVKDMKEYIVNTYDSTLDFLASMYEDENMKNYTSLVKSREKDIKIAYQMISAIPVDKKHFDGVFTTGRMAKAVIKALDDVFFPVEEDLSPKTGPEESIGFEFGGIKTPRKEPRG